jgi:GH15 family glucan-1,4-alpha-glucosidase
MQELQVVHNQLFGDASTQRWIVYLAILIPGLEICKPFILNHLSQNYTPPDRLLKLRIAYWNRALGSLCPSP